MQGGHDLKPIEKFPKSVESTTSNIIHTNTNSSQPFYGSDPSHPKMAGGDTMYSDTSLMDSANVSSGLDKYYQGDPNIAEEYAKRAAYDLEHPVGWKVPCR